YPRLGETYVGDSRSEASRHTVLLSRGRGTFVQDAVLTYRQMLSGWPSYEKGTATTAYPNSHSFERSHPTGPIPEMASACHLKHFIRTTYLVRMKCTYLRERVAYLARSTISVRRQFLDFDSGRVSARRTLSPMPAVFSSSCALTRLVRRIILPYRARCLKYSISTTMVLSILSATTTPRQVLRELRSGAAAVSTDSVTVFPPQPTCGFSFCL